MLSMVPCRFFGGGPARLSQHRFEGQILREVRIEQVDKVPIGLPDRPRVSVEVEEADRADVSEGFSEGDVPIDLISKGIPGEADDWHAAATDKLDVVPLPP